MKMQLDRNHARSNNLTLWVKEKLEATLQITTSPSHITKDVLRNV